MNFQNNEFKRLPNYRIRMYNEIDIRINNDIIYKPLFLYPLNQITFKLLTTPLACMELFKFIQKVVRESS